MELIEHGDGMPKEAKRQFLERLTGHLVSWRSFMPDMYIDPQQAAVTVRYDETSGKTFIQVYYRLQSTIQAMPRLMQDQIMTFTLAFPESDVFSGVEGSDYYKYFKEQELEKTLVMFFSKYIAKKLSW